MESPAKAENGQIANGDIVTSDCQNLGSRPDTSAMMSTSGSGDAKSADKVFFFGATKENGYLSQMFIAPFEVDGVVYNCSEQYFHAQKAEEFGDEKTKGKIMREDKPKKQKKLGRQVQPFDDAQWTRVAYQVVLDATYAKFTTHKDLRDQLFATSNHEIAETSPFDKIWGVGMGLKKAQIHKGDWPGKNLLGRAIVEVRERLRDEHADDSRLAAGEGEEVHDVGGHEGEGEGTGTENFR